MRNEHILYNDIQHRNEPNEWSYIEKCSTGLVIFKTSIFKHYVGRMNSILNNSSIYVNGPIDVRHEEFN